MFGFPREDTRMIHTEYTEKWKLQLKMIKPRSPGKIHANKGTPINIKYKTELKD